MRSLIKKTWFQIIVFGILIGVVLILLDNKFDFFGKKKEDSGNFKGPIEMKKDEMYFAKISFSETSFDFGKVKEGDTISHRIKIKNTGSEPLFIYKAVGSCDCTRARFPTTAIAPGEEVDTYIEFKTKGRKGKQIRKVVFTSNTDPIENTFTLTGEVE